MGDSSEKQCETIFVHSRQENQYYNVLGSLNYIIRIIDSCDDDKLKKFKTEMVEMREKIEDSLLELKYSGD